MLMCLGWWNCIGCDKWVDEVNDFVMIILKRKIIDVWCCMCVDEMIKGCMIDCIFCYGCVDGCCCMMIEMNDDWDDGTSLIGARGRRWANGTSGTSVNVGEGMMSEMKIGWWWEWCLSDRGCLWIEGRNDWCWVVERRGARRRARSRSTRRIIRRELWGWRRNLWRSIKRWSWWLSIMRISLKFRWRSWVKNMKRRKRWRRRRR